MFQTAAEPPRPGRISLAIIGSSRKTSAALEQMAAANSIGVADATKPERACRRGTLGVGRSDMALDLTSAGLRFR